MAPDGDDGGGRGRGVHFVVAVYVGRGADQATRALEVVEHLLAAGHHVHVVTAAPESFTEVACSRLQVREVEPVVLECGLPNALTVDCFASLEELYHRALVPREDVLRSEAKWLESIQAHFVISDAGCAHYIDETAELSSPPLANPMTSLKSLSGLIVDGLRSPENQNGANITPCRIPKIADVGCAKNQNRVKSTASLTPEFVHALEKTPLQSPQVLHTSEKTPSPPSKRQRGRSLPRSPNSTSKHGVPASHERSSSSPPALRSPIRTKNETMALTKAVTVFWDYENCRVPNDTKIEKVRQNIREALHLNFGVDSVTLIAYGVPQKSKKPLQESGVIFVDLPNRKKDAADKLIIADMALSAHDHPSASFMVISGDGDFSRAVKGLVQRGHAVVVAIPSVNTTAASLMNSGSCIVDWPSLARGTIVIQKSLPDEISVVKDNMVELFESHGGYIDLVQILPEYHKRFHKQIRLANYGALKLVDLLEMMGDTFYVMDGTQHVFLRTLKEGSSAMRSVTSEILTDISIADVNAYGPAEDELLEQMVDGEDKPEKGFEDA